LKILYAGSLTKRVLSKVSEDPHHTAFTYTFKASLHSSKADRIVKQVQSAAYLDHSCKHQNDTKSEFCQGKMLLPAVLGIVRNSREGANHRALSLNERQFMRDITALHSSHVYHFIGASHMRYNFDAVAEYYLGAGALMGVDRKHDKITVRNLKYNFISNSKIQSEFLISNCAAMQNASEYGDTRKYTIIFQTGAWDLTIASLRRALHDPVTFARLLEVFGDIFSGTTKCGGLSHLLWLTSVPHPVCFDDSNPNCNGDRGYRINPAINALNRHLVTNILRLSQLRNTQIQLSVVDAYHIVHPRLIFNEQSEVACLNHFTCRVTDSKKTNVLAQTPGGTAVVKSILNALSFELSSL
jgi:hypothetical protein